MTTTATRSAYQLSTGVWVIAECQQCGRGFVSIGAANRGRDPYPPRRERQRYFVPSHACGGRIVWLAPTEGSRAQERGEAPSGDGATAPVAIEKPSES